MKDEDEDEDEDEKKKTSKLPMLHTPYHPTHQLFF